MQESTNWLMILIGLTENEAAFKLEKAGFKYRISKRDGHPMVLTRDYHLDRFNLEIENDKVVKFNRG